MMTAAEARANAAEDVRQARKSALLGPAWEQSARNWLALARALEGREARQRRYRWWKPWTW